MHALLIFLSWFGSVWFILTVVIAIDTILVFAVVAARSAVIRIVTDSVIDGCAFVGGSVIQDWVTFIIDIVFLLALCFHHTAVRG